MLRAQVRDKGAELFESSLMLFMVRSSSGGLVRRTRVNKDMKSEGK